MSYKNTIFNERYRPASRQGSSVFSEIEKTSVTQANINNVDVKASASPHLTKAVVVLLIAVAVIVIVTSVTAVVVVLNLKEEGGETTTGDYELFVIVVI